MMWRVDSKPKASVWKSGAACIIAGLIGFALLAVYIADCSFTQILCSPSGPTTSSGTGTMVLLSWGLVAVFAALSLIAGLVLKGIGAEENKVTEGGHRNPASFLSAGLGISGLLVSGFLWFFYVDLYIGSLSWGAVSAAWLGPMVLMCPLPVAALAAGALAMARSRRLGGGQRGCDARPPSSVCWDCCPFSSRQPRRRSLNKDAMHEVRCLHLL